ncbi:MAG TPA: radical SAM protein, partial [Candidatus Bathyarchaeia archaeon]|nr:radical SAM protein [Candidatus Bathyarchaeia archaeon]
FCSIHAWHRQVRGARLRFRSPAAVAREMIEMHRNQGVRVFTFHDDDFLHPDPARSRERARSILEAAEDGMRSPFAFIVKCRPDQVEEDLFAYLKSKGLVRAYVGIETASALGIRTLNRRVKPEENERALDTLRSLGLLACFNLLIFHPETTLEELDENIDFLSRNLDHPFDVGRTELYAHAALETRMVAEGRAIGDWRGYDYRIADPRAEEAFSLFVTTLWDRHFGAHSIMHRAQDLSFRMDLLGRFYPRIATPELHSRVSALVREVNASTVDHLRRISAAAREGSGTLSAAERASFVESMRSDVESRLRRQSIQWAALALELECRSRIGRALPASTSAFEWAPRIVSRTAVAVPLLALAFCGCSDTTTVVDPLPPPVAHFGADVEPYLSATCATSGCHSTQHPAAGLTLTTGQSYDNLVNVPSSELPAMARVKPGRSDSSYVVCKLEGTQLAVGGSGEKMPIGGPVSQSFLAKLIDWIGRGAKRD